MAVIYRMPAYIGIPERHRAVVSKQIYHPAVSGRQVRRGSRQSIPSSSIDNYAVVITSLPLAADGQTNRPRSRRFENRHAPWLSHQITTPDMEHEEMTAIRVCFENRLRLGGNPDEALPRNTVEHFFNKLKYFRAVATHYDKRDDNYLAFVKLASLRIWLRFNESVT